MNIKVGFSRPKKFKAFSWLIMKGYGIPYSHVYIRFYSEKYQRWLVYQASHTMVNFMGMEMFLQNSEIVEEFDLSINSDEHDEMVQFAIDNAGKPYGVMNAVGLGVMRIAEIFGKQIKNPFGDGDKTAVCCEWIGIILEKIVKVHIQADLDSLTPKQLYIFMKNLPLNHFASTPNGEPSNNNA